MARLKVIVTVKEAAAAGRVSTATIRRLIDAGRLRAVRVGRSVRIPRAELEKMLTKGGAK